MDISDQTTSQCGIRQSTAGYQKYNPLNPGRLNLLRTWIISDKQGQGGQACVYSASHNKLPMFTERVMKVGLNLQVEFDILERLWYRFPTIVPRPYFHWTGDNNDYLLMEHAGVSLQDYAQTMKRDVSISEAATLAIRLLYVIERVHSEGFLHCDIKPSNVMIPKSPRGSKKLSHEGAFSKARLIDFAISKRYRDTNGRHAPISVHEIHGGGTIPFMSMNTHCCLKPSRRDDLESLAYTLICLVQYLPWKNDDDLKTTYDLKKTFYTDRSETALFGELLQYARSLRYEEKPDYAYWRRRFHLFRHSLSNPSVAHRKLNRSAEPRNLYCQTDSSRY